jgi:paraquat-inducible protein B
LNKGAPVEFRGIKIGEVVDVKMEYVQNQSLFRIPVLMVIEPERIAIEGKNDIDRERLIRNLIAKGLRAQLRTGLLLTGRLFINLTLMPDAPTPKLQFAGAYPIIPSAPGTTEEITAGITQFLKRLEKLPLEQIGGDLSASLRAIRQTLESQDFGGALAALNRSLQQLEVFTAALNRDVTPEVKAVLDELQQTLSQTKHTLAAAEGLVGGSGALGYDLQQMVGELTKAGRAITTLADYLQRNPDALIFGKGTPLP